MAVLGKSGGGRAILGTGGGQVVVLRRRGHCEDEDGEANPFLRITCHSAHWKGFSDGASVMAGARAVRAMASS
jgi:hypothetical protein